MVTPCAASLCAPLQGSLVAKPNYSFEKRQRDLAKKAKQEEKRQQKLANKAAGINGAADIDAPALNEGSEESTVVPA